MNTDLQHIIDNWFDAGAEDQLKTIDQTFKDVIELLTGDEELFLSTSFSRLAFFIQKHNLSTGAKLGLFRLRAELQKLTESTYIPDNGKAVLHLSREILAWLKQLDESGKPAYFDLDSALKLFPQENASIPDFAQHLRMMVVGVSEDGLFYGIDESNPSQELLIDFPENDSFTSRDIQESFGTVIPYPFYVSLFDISIDNGKLSPAYYALLPDYLVDVTSIAMGFQHDGFSIWPYYIRRVLPTETTYYMLLGNIINHTLDQLIVDSSIGLHDLFREIFRLFPLDLIRMDDQEVRKLLSAVRAHTDNLQRVLTQDFGKLNLDPSKCELEPTFLSSKYGLQGRLDVLHRDEETTIIELKSGKPFRPNSYGIKADHYVQTLLYDLMIRAAGISRSPRNFILYSSQDKQAIRYAPPVKAIQMEAMKARNQIVLMDAVWRHPDIRHTTSLFERFNCDPPESLGSFIHRDVRTIRKVLKNARPTERAYFEHFFSFVMREMAISKMGQRTQGGAGGLSSIWLKKEEEKLNDYSILSYLKLTDHQKKDGNVYLTFGFSEQTDPLANFRKGDVVVLYPCDGKSQPALRNQVHKSSIIDRTQDSMVVRLRSKQYDQDFFTSTEWWNIERDVLDSSFNGSFDSLFLFLGAPDHKRAKWLGVEAPQLSEVDFPTQYTFSPKLLDEQKQVIRKIYRANDYFLLWGPPGTGKTSVMVRELTQLYHQTSEKDIYLLAYTNKAVDELSGAVKSLNKNVSTDATRIGSRHSCNPVYHDMLFNEQIKEINDRQGLIDYIESKRIFISTLASFWGRRQLIKRRGEGILIVDEASQILEPSIIGLLPYFEKVILVGDHLQLPAVSVQHDKTSIVQSEGLRKIGITNLKMSLFERLFLRIQERKWDDHCAILRHQGRMHQNIMGFVNKNFYHGGLSLIPGLKRQIEEMDTKGSLPGRLLYVPSTAFPEDSMIKNNRDEAEKVVQTVERWLSSTNRKLSDLHEDDIGVITPFRAQIALIRHFLNEAFGEAADVISVDTVERYQGSARDVIIISLCLNRKSQLKTIVSQSDSGVDRKFNVALTRAREQVIVIGNQDIMSEVDGYHAYIKAAHTMSFTNATSSNE